MAFFLGLNVLNDKQHRLTHPHGVTFEMKQSIPKFMQILYSIWYVDWWPLLGMLTIRRTWMKSTGARYSNELQRPDLKIRHQEGKSAMVRLHIPFLWCLTHHLTWMTKNRLMAHPPTYVDGTNHTTSAVDIASISRQVVSTISSVRLQRWRGC